MDEDRNNHDQDQNQNYANQDENHRTNKRNEEETKERVGEAYQDPLFLKVMDKILEMDK